MRLETIPLSLLILLSVLVITEQQAKAQVTYDISNQNPDRMGAQRLQKILTAAGFVLIIILLFGVWQELYPR
jgi:hypothetical protein